eukprot:SAG11_NODE_16137_length_556_cov_0.715536_1_plen_52_part_00
MRRAPLAQRLSAKGERLRLCLNVAATLLQLGGAAEAVAQCDQVRPPTDPTR